MKFLIAFGIGALAYSLIERRDREFIGLQLLGCVLFVGIGALLLRVSNDAFRGVSVGLLFVLIGLGPRVLLRHGPVEANVGNARGAAAEIPIGIVDFVWISIMGAAVAFVAFANGVPPFTQRVIPEGIQGAYYEKALDSTVFLLGKVIDAMFLTAGGLAACMGILWAGEIWRRSEYRGQYILTTVTSIKMVVAYFVAIIGVLVWIGIPLYTRMGALLEMLRHH